MPSKLPMLPAGLADSLSAANSALESLHRITISDELAKHQSAAEKLNDAHRQLKPLRNALRALDRVKHSEDQVKLAQTALKAWEYSGVRQSELARQIGISQASVSRLLKGTAALKPELAVRINELAAAVSARAPTETHQSLPSSDTVTLTIPKRMMQAAEDLNLNIQELFNTVGMEAVRAELKSRWVDENREAINQQNAYFETHGLPLAKYRTW